MKSIDISVVIPIYNEAETIVELHQELKKHLEVLQVVYEVIYVDDGSRDASFSILKNLAMTDKQLKFIRFTRNFGHQNAILAGLNHASGEAIVMMDGDLQDPPDVIPEMYKKFKEGFQIVSAQRTERQKEGLFKKLTAKIYYRIFRTITHNDMPYDAGDFKIISRDVARHICEMKEKNKFLRGQISWLGLKSAIVKYKRAGRKYGETKFSNRKMIKFAWDGITSFSNLPLKVAIYCGLIFSIVSFGIVLYALYSKFILNQVVTGWTSLIISVTFIGGVQLLCLGIMGEYISRISDNLRDRPDYVIEEENVRTMNKD